MRFIGWWYVRKLCQYIHSVDLVLRSIPHIEIDLYATKAVISGSDLYGPGVVSVQDNILIGDMVVIEHDGEILALGEAQMNKHDMNKRANGTAVHITKVLV